MVSSCQVLLAGFSVVVSIFTVIIQCHTEDILVNINLVIVKPDHQNHNNLPIFWLYGVSSDVVDDCYSSRK